MILSALSLALGTASAASADWQSYLCRYGDGETKLVKVNMKDERVKIDDRDQDGVKISEKFIHFEPHHGAVMFDIKRENLAVSVIELRSTGARQLAPGTCKLVDD